MSQGRSKELSRYAWVKPLVAGKGPRYLQIADLIGDAIRAGALAPGDQVPPQRSLAVALGVDLTTVTRAYTEARNRGLISSFSGRGSFVAAAGQGVDSVRVDLSMNVPPQPSERDLAELIRSGIDGVLKRYGAEQLSPYDTRRSDASIIQAGQAWLKPALGDLASGELLLAPGTQAAIYAVLKSVLRRGETVLSEPLTYPGFLLAARTLELNVVPLEVDEHGVTPDAIQRAKRATGARVIYLNPTLQNPTAHVMPTRRRQDVAKTLQKLKMTLIEDDPYRFLLNDAPPTLASFLGGGNTYYLASLSKCLWPGLRTSFVRAPGDTGLLMENLQAFGMGGAPLLYSLSEQWIRTGLARQLLVEVQREARARQTLARSMLPKDVSTHPSGLHIWLPLPPQWNRQIFADALEQRGIAVATSDAFSVAADPVDAVRISVGGATSQPELASALRQINDFLGAERRRQGRPIV